MSPETMLWIAHENRLSIYFELSSKLALVTKKCLLNPAVSLCQEANGRALDIVRRRKLLGWRGPEGEIVLLVVAERVDGGSNQPLSDILGRLGY